MSDRKPSQEPNQPKTPPKSKGAGNLAIFLMSALTAAGGAKIALGSNDSTVDREDAKIHEISDLERRLLRLESGGTWIDSHIKAAKSGNAKEAECNDIDTLEDVFTSARKSAALQREMLVSINYITAGQNISYRLEEEKSYASVVTKIGQLRVICQSLFSKAPITEPDDVPVKNGLPEGLDKPEISFNYDQ